jgi:hypothetical protein
MDSHILDTIDRHGDPLAFLLQQGKGRSPLHRSGRDVIKVEARQLAGHQKEAVVTEGADASAWRLTSDEGKHLRGTDLAPFPLGFFNAGMQSDLYGRVRMLAAARGIGLGMVEIRVVNHYWLTGSFIHGTGEGHAEAPDIDVRVQSDASTESIVALVAAARTPHPRSLTCAARCPKMHSPSTSTADGERWRESPTPRVPMRQTPIALIAGPRAPSMSTRAGT